MTKLEAIKVMVDFFYKDVEGGFGMMVLTDDFIKAREVLGEYRAMAFYLQLHDLFVKDAPIND